MVCGNVVFVIFDIIPTACLLEELYDSRFVFCLIIFELLSFLWLSLGFVYSLFCFILLLCSSVWLLFEFVILYLLRPVRNFFLLLFIISKVESLRSVICSLFGGSFFWLFCLKRIFVFFVFMFSVSFVLL